MVSSSIGTAIPHARISVGGIKHDVYTAEKGDYWRLLVPGRYNVTVSAVGYETLTQTVDVPSYSENVGDGEVTLDFTLMRDDPQHWYDYFNSAFRDPFAQNETDAYLRWQAGTRSSFTNRLLK